MLIFVFRWITLCVALFGCEAQGPPPPADPLEDDDADVTEEPDGPAQREFVVIRRRHVEVKRFSHLAVCEGDVVALDAHVPAVMNLTGIEPELPLVYQWVDKDEVLDRCSSGAAGCVRGGVGYGMSLATGFHELNHLIVGPFDGRTGFWVEGFAVAFEPREVWTNKLHPAAMLEAGTPVDYPTAGVFVRQIWRQEGPSVAFDIAGASTNRETALTAFADIMGESLETYGDRFIAEAPDVSASFFPQREPTPWTDDRWVHILELDCNTAETLVGHYGEGMRALAWLEVAAEGRYELAVSEGRASVVPRLGPDGNLPLLRTEQGLLQSSTDFVEAGEFSPGRYEVEVEIEGFEPRSVAVELRPYLGPTPVHPE